nr:MAG TPA: hypothetical protein [Caudoviricetes sp.]
MEQSTRYHPGKRSSRGIQLQLAYRLNSSRTKSINQNTYFRR